MKHLGRALTVAALFLLSPHQTKSQCTGREQQNKQIVLAYYNEFSNKHDLAAAQKYLGAHFKQHAQDMPDGISGWKSYLQNLFRQHPDIHTEVTRAVAEGDYVHVVAHATAAKGTQQALLMDLYRLRHGKIVEHWGVLQEIVSNSANSNTPY